jgi:hypothetical protein
MQIANLKTSLDIIIETTAGSSKGICFTSALN